MGIRHLSMLFIFLTITPAEATARRVFATLTRYITSPCAVIAAGYLTSREDVQAAPRFTAGIFHNQAQQARHASKTIATKPASPAIMVRPVSSGPSFTLSDETIQASFSEDFLRKTSFKTLITATWELTPLTLMRYLDISLDAYRDIYNWEWRSRGGPEDGGHYIPPYSLEEKLACLKRLLHDHPAAYAEAEEGWLVFFHTDEWEKKYGHRR